MEVAVNAYIEGPSGDGYADKASAEGMENDYEDHHLTVPDKEDTDEPFRQEKLRPRDREYRGSY